MSVKWRGRVLSILSDKFLRIFHLNTDEKEIYFQIAVWRNSAADIVIYGLVI